MKGNFKAPMKTSTKVVVPESTTTTTTTATTFTNVSVNGEDQGHLSVITLLRLEMLGCLVDTLVLSLSEETAIY